jgi:uncharacterized membrane protein YfcA
MSFGDIGLITVELALYAPLASPGILLGVWVGSRLFHVYGGLKLREVILRFLTLTAILTLLDTLRSG